MRLTVLFCCTLVGCSTLDYVQPLCLANFTYKETIYNRSCSCLDNHDVPWCSTNDKGDWRNCTDSDRVAGWIVPHCGNLPSCLSTFNYLGITYRNECSCLDSPVPWCYTDYIGNYQNCGPVDVANGFLVPAVCDQVVARGPLLFNDPEAVRDTSTVQTLGINIERAYPSLLPRFRTGQATDMHSCYSVRDVPPDLRLAEHMDSPIGTFYSKYTEAYGIPVIGSSFVSDESLMMACYNVRIMLASRYDIRNALYKTFARVGVMADNQSVITMPEYTYLTPGWAGIRGAGGTIGKPLSLTSDDNQRCQDVNGMQFLDLTLHEFGHALHLMGAMYVIPDFSDRLSSAYNEGRTIPGFNGTYMMTSNVEFFAEGIGLYFAVEGGYTTTITTDQGPVIQKVSGRAGLQTVLPKLVALLDEIFPCSQNLLKYVPRCEFVKNITQHVNSSVDQLCTIPSTAGTCGFNDTNRQPCGPTVQNASMCLARGCCVADNGSCYYKQLSSDVTYPRCLTNFTYADVVYTMSCSCVANNNVPWCYTDTGWKNCTQSDAQLGWTVPNYCLSTTTTGKTTTTTRASTTKFATTTGSTVPSITPTTHLNNATYVVPLCLKEFIYRSVVYNMSCSCAHTNDAPWCKTSEGWRNCSEADQIQGWTVPNCAVNVVTLMTEAHQTHEADSTTIPLYSGTSTSTSSLPLMVAFITVLFHAFFKQLRE